MAKGDENLTGSERAAKKINDENQATNDYWKYLTSRQQVTSPSAASALRDVNVGTLSTGQQTKLPTYGAYNPTDPGNDFENRLAAESRKASNVIGDGVPIQSQAEMDATAQTITQERQASDAKRLGSKGKAASLLGGSLGLNPGSSKSYTRSLLGF